MKNRRKRVRRSFISVKTLVLLITLVLGIGITAGGSLAWLTAAAAPVTNTFTTSNISVELKETTTDYKMVPGHTIKKDPKATVVSGSEECWLFVKIEKANDVDKYITYTIAEGWTVGNGDGEGKDGVPEGVIYRKVETTDIGKEFSILAGDSVTVIDTVTNAMMKTASTNKPTITFTAYASQLNKNATEKFDVATAWNNCKNETAPNVDSDNNTEGSENAGEETPTETP